MKIKSSTETKTQKKSNKGIIQLTKRISEIIDILRTEYGEPTIQLTYSNSFELLIATILSAQCKDARVNIVTKTLFNKYKSKEDYLSVPIQELEKDIFSTGFYREKAQRIIGTARSIIEKFNGNVPSTMEELLELPGVGRKTANVILGHIYKVPSIVVDTHVIRISNRIGLVSTKSPEKIEFELMKIIPKDLWVIFTHYFINHGRKVCKARTPQCENCKILGLCDFGLKSEIK